MDNNQQRRPAGTPTGGQFSGRTHAEGGVALDGPTPEQVAAVYHQVNASAEHFSRRLGVDRDELATRLLDELSFADSDKYMAGAYIHGVAKFISSKMRSGNSNGADFEADREFARRRTDWEQANGREMPSRLRDELAEDIRQYQPPRRRARKGFHLPAPATTFLDTTDESSPVFTDPSFHALAADLGIDGEQARFDHADDEKIKAVADSEGPWAALAQVYGAPNPRVASITEVTAAKIRRHVKELGGAGFVATAYLNAEIDDDGAESLFVPFGGKNLDVKGREKVAQTLAGLPRGEPGKSHADTAFTDAIRVATRSKKRAPRDWSRSARKTEK